MDPVVREEIQKAVEDSQFDGSKEDLKKTIYNISVDVLGLRKKKHQDWFDDNNLEINQFLKPKTIFIRC